MESNLATKLNLSSMVDLFFSDAGPYFVITMYNRETVKIRNPSYCRFPGSAMKRGVVLVDVARLTAAELQVLSLTIN